ncbi:hypothetical protein [Frondihabitans australicus]|uniref:hypothetical protein n=1 Tax=Frondihabitans australicus TaxID=386892 RepID=UPI0014741482|nr:hypothetical protein [Frondihabitans australicus]
MTSISVVGQTIVTDGYDAVWLATATNNGTTTTSGPEVITLTYNAGANPTFPNVDGAYTNVQGLGPSARECVVSSAHFTVTCTTQRLAAGASVTVAIAAQTVAGVIPRTNAVNWTAEASSGPGDDNGASNFETSAVVTQAAPAPSTDPIVSDSTVVYGGHSFESPNQMYSLIMQADGNLVESSGGRAIWSTQTAGNPGAYFLITESGEGVVYSGDGRVLWSQASPRATTVYPQVVVSDSGKLVATDPNGTLWSVGGPTTTTPTAPSAITASAVSPAGQILAASSARLLLQSDGNLVDYVGSKAVWSSGTYGHAGDHLSLQADGNLVLYMPSGRPIWFTRTGGSGAGNRLTLASSGLLTLSHGTKVLWHAG